MSINLDLHTPKQPLREAILNSIAHKDYSSANPIQLSVYRDKIIFWEKINCRKIGQYYKTF